MISRYVRSGPNKKRLSDPAEIQAELAGKSQTKSSPPDLIVAGRSNVQVPYVVGQTPSIKSPFVVPNCGPMLFAVKEIAFGIGICHMLWALDFIQLGQMPWGPILGDALGLAANLKDANS